MKEDKYIWDNFKNDADHALSYIYNQNIDFLFFYGKKFTIEEDFILDMIARLPEESLQGQFQVVLQSFHCSYHIL